MESPRASSLSGSFRSLNVSQFLGALNDNFFRFVMALSLVARASDSVTGKIEETPIFIAGAVFALPFILFSSTAGVLADRLSKRRLIVAAKFLEVIVMALGLAAFLLNSPIFIYVVLFLMAAQSTLFGPCKFGILPEMVPPERLSYANGLMEMFAYLAIILGTVAAAAVYEYWCDPGGAYASTFLCWRASVLCLVLATVGFLFSLGVKETGVRLPEKRE
jgi:acyl-[acyl-carrier-protein]-phospholipid O-acyltransferase/long-chain-fatty-acid--[acyl-carrier-protein] ligase